mmetsp:Transcript_6846/g.12081  ORF Transcript_6846/g.12081 Transcript_6846/m.12081 type:complete len:479 (+) Transcript_6846:235-1671(+)
MALKTATKAIKGTKSFKSKNGSQKLPKKAHRSRQKEGEQERKDLIASKHEAIAAWVSKEPLAGGASRDWTTWEWKSCCKAIGISRKHVDDVAYYYASHIRDLASTNKKGKRAIQPSPSTQLATQQSDSDDDSDKSDDSNESGVSDRSADTSNSSNSPNHRSKPAVPQAEAEVLRETAVLKRTRMEADPATQNNVNTQSAKQSEKAKKPRTNSAPSSPQNSSNLSEKESGASPTTNTAPAAESSNAAEQDKVSETENGKEKGNEDHSSSHNTGEEAPEVHAERHTRELKPLPTRTTSRRKVPGLQIQYNGPFRTEIFSRLTRLTGAAPLPPPGIVPRKSPLKPLPKTPVRKSTGFPKRRTPAASIEKQTEAADEPGKSTEAYSQTQSHAAVEPQPVMLPDTAAPSAIKTQLRQIEPAPVTLYPEATSIEIKKKCASNEGKTHWIVALPDINDGEPVVMSNEYMEKHHMTAIQQYESSNL